MVLKSLLRTYFLELGLETFFDRIISNFPNHSLGTGEHYLGPFEVGMRFSKLRLWEDTDGDRFEYRDVRIEDIEKVFEKSGEQHIIIEFSYEEPAADIGFDFCTSNLRNMTFYR